MKHVDYIRNTLATVECKRIAHTILSPTQLGVYKLICKDRIQLAKIGRLYGMYRSTMSTHVIRILNKFDRYFNGEEKLRHPNFKSRHTFR